jgi:hypothetical protein
LVDHYAGIGAGCDLLPDGAGASGLGLLGFGAGVPFDRSRFGSSSPFHIASKSD